jgi:uncharacterized membrane protein
MPWAWGYSRSVLWDILGLVGMTLFIIGVVALAAAVTWLVVKISPARN